MAHIISLIACYTAIGAALTILLKLERRTRCMTKAPEDSQSKTVPSPTGQTSPISIPQYSGHFNPHELQDDTEFRSRYRGGLMPLHQPVSGFSSEPSTVGGHNTNQDSRES